MNKVFKIYGLIALILALIFAAYLINSYIYLKDVSSGKEFGLFAFLVEVAYKDSLILTPLFAILAFLILRRKSLLFVRLFYIALTSFFIWIFSQAGFGLELIIIFLYLISGLVLFSHKSSKNYFIKTTH